jgi:Adenosine deaminase
VRYVLHFLKSIPEKKNTCSEFLEEIRCRDYEKRMEVEREAKAIDLLLCSSSKYRHQIIGIDAASSELDNRPEVFGQAFRFLKGKRDNGKYGHLKENMGRPQIRATFHAGEDFFDVVDGLRAIDEAIKYLNLGEGDRIGHAIALGVDVRDYYMSKHRSIMMPKQWLLDNYCWLVSRIHKYNLHQFSSFCQYLRWDFQNLFMKMYKDVEFDYKSGITPELYFEAWRLRGDDPSLYKLKEKEEYEKEIERSFYIDVQKKNRLTYWSKCGINENYPYKGCKREVPEVNRLYYEYHYNRKIKERGEQMFPFEIKKEYIELVEAVQECYQKEIRERHLGIETNPSSNVLIGTFKRYDKHPLVNLFNLGLETDPEKIRNCPQLFVSINTDDQGVFNTYLENEYALMALALEKMEDENGNKLYNPAMIYDWLDRIRAMGMEMRFGKV